LTIASVVIQVLSQTLTVAGLVQQQPWVTENPVLALTVEHVLKSHTGRERAVSEILALTGDVGTNLGWDLNLRQQISRVIEEPALPWMLPVRHIPVTGEGTSESLGDHLITRKPTVWRTEHIINEVPARQANDPLNCHLGADTEHHIELI